LLQSFEIDSGCKLSKIGKRAFSWSSLRSVCIPSSVEVIYEFSFEGCDHLLDFSFEAGGQITNPSESAFQDCFVLRSICIASSIEVISRSSFSGCAARSVVTFEQGCKISLSRESALEGCWPLLVVGIPSSVETISNYCFWLLPDTFELRF
jgi:hypothetical protein